MRYFVSYARRDHTIERLCEIRARFSDLGCVYVDDLEMHDPSVDRTQTVVNALAHAENFIAVQSENYLTTEWTRWEFASALHMGIEMAALLPNNRIAKRSDPQWPWPRHFPHARATAAPVVCEVSITESSRRQS
ncbi:toll/interleukin-1 receptor domain-containing protein [Streptomyces asoensis]|uniref:toll/interleukin-1 receptor domain-containing protein n=1 Tax=Streptomyces asoensis TaxID=249586 RepID=UPI0033E7ABD6